MTNNSESPDQALSSIDSNRVARPKDKTSLILRLGHIFSSSGFKSPKSPKSVSSSRGSSPSHGSPCAKMRYSWQLGTFDGENNRSPRSPESGISSFSSSSKSSSKSSSIGMNATSSPKSPSTPKSPCSSIWHMDSAGAVECATNEDEDEEGPHHQRAPSQRSRRRGGTPRHLSPLFSPFSRSLLLSVSMHLVVVFRRTLRAAHEVAVEARAFISLEESNELQRPNTSRSADMKYSPQQQQQQQKQRKSESSDAASMDATSPSVAQEQRKTSSTSSSTRAAVCRSPSTGMFAWMRVFRLASMLHQVGC